jgi:hypothetical protein
MQEQGVSQYELTSNSSPNDSKLYQLVTCSQQSNKIVCWFHHSYTALAAYVQAPPVAVQCGCAQANSAPKKVQAPTTSANAALWLPV